jgi:predicted CXXCH cytochrome family protein
MGIAISRASCMGCHDPHGSLTPGLMHEVTHKPLRDVCARRATTDWQKRSAVRAFRVKGVSRIGHV